ncbi:DUF4870 domain-containing protein [Flavobacterium microcysteis]
METSSNQKTTSAFVHLSTLTQYFIPFGNYIFPIIIWGASKKDSDYIDHHGKQAINFQLSLLLYSLILCLIAIPIFIVTIFKNMPVNAIIHDDDFIIENFHLEHITGMVIIGITAAVLFFTLKVAEFFLIIYASIKAANGELYKYPLTINFLKTPKKEENKTEISEENESSINHQSENETV